MKIIRTKHVERIIGSIMYDKFKTFMKGKTIPIVNDNNAYVYSHDVISFFNHYYFFDLNKADFILEIDRNSIEVKEELE